VNHDTTPKSPAEQWDIVIKPRNNWLELHLADIWKYRDLIRMFVVRDFVALYKQTILGPLWYLIQPLLSTAIFTVIFGRIAQIPTDGVPPVLFYLSGIVCWSYFSDCLTSSSGTFLNNASIFGKVYFPRLTVPISVVISNMIKFSIQFALFLTVLVYYSSQNTFNLHLSPFILLIPILVLQIALLGLGFGIIVSSLTTKYRDLAYLVSFGVQLWMYASPVVYPISQVPEIYRQYYMLNPMSQVITNFRILALGVGQFDLEHTLLSWGITFFILAAGILIFNRVEKSFVDTI